MTQPVAKGRWTARPDGPFVVFLIGFRIHRLFAAHQWLPILGSMPPMLRELAAHPELGCLGFRTCLETRGATVIQYWRNFDQLVAYAHGKIHMEAWQQFYRRTSQSNAVGVWHETFQVAAGGSECIYANMPRFGLGLWANHQPAEGALHNAQERMHTVAHGSPQEETLGNPQS